MSGENIRALAEQWRTTTQIHRHAAANGKADVARPRDIESVVTFGVDVQAKGVQWLIPDRVPLGAITGLGGEPGLGKSALTALYAAEGSRGLHGDPWTTLFVSAEDSASRVIKPRLLALDADQARAGFLSIRDEHGTMVPTLPDHIALIRGAMERHRARLLVLDPLNAFLSGDVDSHKDQSIRRVLAPLAALAEELEVAVIVVLHTRKATGGPAVYRLGGSVGYGGAARSVLGFGRDPDDPEGERGAQRVLGHVKCNWGPLAGTLVYRHEALTVIDGDELIDTHRLVYAGESDADPSAAFDAPKGEDRGADVEEAICEALAEGAVKSRDVKTAVSGELGVTAKTVERRAMRMADSGDLVVEEETHAGGRLTMWRLPGGRDRGVGTAPVPTPLSLPSSPVAEPNPEPDRGGRDRDSCLSVPVPTPRREPVCAKDHHRSSDWAMPNATMWICGACHPPSPVLGQVVYRHPDKATRA